ncbi:MAG: DNA-binding protein [Candidatus Saganbacteria bacterium]|uniref:DNA-binding protein n=1 Tax=Candidatus Saganbacteria bacterium TaxID=2575572 RepID=A0A833L053_UNCSA|nr:MAG: DNA-binding protein [Candidatus Saganbacteria bacterium]
MSNFDDLKRRQISETIQKKIPIPIENIGTRLKDIRESMGMTQKQLAKRINISQPVVSKIEENAATSSLINVERYARIFGIDFQGVFTSEKAMEEIIKGQAEKKAKQILDRTFSNMAMEKQAPQEDAYKFQLNQLIEELSANPSSKLWED